jgi:hypothetical protein
LWKGNEGGGNGRGGMRENMVIIQSFFSWNLLLFQV